MRGYLYEFKDRAHTFVELANTASDEAERERVKGDLAAYFARIRQAGVQDGWNDALADRGGW